MSIGEVVKYNLQFDYTDNTAQQEYLNNTGCYSSSSDVPIWMYTSLATLLSCTSSELAGRIIADLGEARTPSGPCIVIETDLSYEAVTVGDGLRADITGNDTAYLKLLLKNVKTDKSIYLVKNMAQRIRYLLDSNIRQYSNPARTVDLEISSNEFVQNYFRCYYQRIDLPVSSENLICFWCSFIWQFGVVQVN